MIILGEKKQLCKLHKVTKKGLAEPIHLLVKIMSKIPWSVVTKEVIRAKSLFHCTFWRSNSAQANTNVVKSMHQSQQIDYLANLPCSCLNKLLMSTGLLIIVITEQLLLLFTPTGLFFIGSFLMEKSERKIKVEKNHLVLYGEGWLHCWESIHIWSQNVQNK